MAPNTIRAKLTLITLAIISALLVLIGVVSEVSARAATLQSIDRDLERRGEDFTRLIMRRPNIAMGPPPDMMGGGPNGGDGKQADWMTSGIGKGIFGPGDSPDGKEGGPNGGGGPNGPGGPDFFGPSDGPGKGKRDPLWVAPIVVSVPFDEKATAPFRDKPFDMNGYRKAAKGERNFTTVMVDSEPRRVYSSPARSEGKVFAVIQVAYSMGDAYTALDRLHSTLIQFAVPSGIIFGGIASFILVSQLLSPLRRITQEAERIGATGFEERLQPRGRDEFAALATTLNGMLERLSQTYRMEQETSRRLQQTVEQQRRFTSDASHELKTPLAVIKANTGLLLSSPGSEEENRESLAAIDAAASRMNGLVRDLLVLARTDSGRSASKHRACDLRYIVESALSGVAGAKDRVTLQSSAPDAIVMASPEDLSRVFINLIDNALKHSGAQSVEVGIARRAGRYEVTVTDRGQGIDAAHLPHLFERFYRIDTSRTVDTGGSGLGLAICKGIVEAHGGQISVDSKVGVGTRFTVFLPVAQPTEQSD